MTQEYEFKAEIQKLLDILSKSLYTHKEVFLRELISNSTDALKKIHFISLKDKNIVDPDAELRIDIFLDEEEGTITIKDTGVGMTQEELIENLGTIASSGSQKFLEALEKRKEEKTELDLDIIGQFGIGFYSVFMVAKTVKVYSKSYKKDAPAYVWESDGSGNFTLEPCDKEDRGTEIVIELQKDDQEYVQKYRIESIIKKYSNFVPYPIYVYEVEEIEEVEEEEEVEEAEIVEEEEEGETKEEEKGEEEEEEEKEPEPVNEVRP
ncbi:MAG: ATP-binding protein, partial [Candidatus Aenigmatarchaeota archaeon]